jgi:hypothetical protein
MSQQDQPKQSAVTSDPKTKKRRKWPWITAGVVVLFVIIVAVSNNGNGSKKSAGPEGAQSSPSKGIEKGTYMVGEGITPGTYKAPGGDNCYWERDKDLEGNVGSILANGGLSGGQQIVQILPTDKAFKTHGCGTWTRASAGDSAQAAPPETPADASKGIEKGTFLVGVGIAPGTYKTPGGDNCYWERDNDLEGNVGSILANGGLSGGQQIVEILPTDKAFKTHGCGTWTPVSGG